jgi:predicted dehydrogenase
MSTTVRWGILSTGKIAHKFAEGLRSAEGAQLVAVGSRTDERAEAFADEFDVPHRHGSYAALAADADVDAIYVATPHPMHLDDSLTCIEAGKAVLCEKPLTVNAEQAKRLISAARERKVFCMEAMWTRFLPAIVRLRELLQAGAIGEVRMLAADFGFRAELDPAGRLFDPEYAGGGLLDVGVYTVSLASMVLGPPASIVSQARLGVTGVDEQAAVVLAHEGGALAALTCAVRAHTSEAAWIAGTEGLIRVHRPWWRSAGLTVESGGTTEEIDLPMRGNGYNYEADEVARCLEAGRLESPVMPLDESLQIMRTMDRIRAQWPLRYPME